MKISHLNLGKQCRPLCLIVVITLLFCAGWLDSALAVSAKEIDAKADKALERLHNVPGGKEFAEKAQALESIPLFLAKTKVSYLIRLAAFFRPRTPAVVHF